MVGFREQDYVNWLAARKRQHNITNMFLFVRDMSKRDADADADAERIQEL
jgi:hypothetical protein